MELYDRWRELLSDFRSIDDHTLKLHVCGEDGGDHGEAECDPEAHQWLKTESDRPTVDRYKAVAVTAANLIHPSPFLFSPGERFPYRGCGISYIGEVDGSSENNLRFWLDYIGWRTDHGYQTNRVYEPKSGDWWYQERYGKERGTMSWDVPHFLDVTVIVVQTILNEADAYRSIAADGDQPTTDAPPESAADVPERFEPVPTEKALSQVRAAIAECGQEAQVWRIEKLCSVRRQEFHRAVKYLRKTGEFLTPPKRRNAGRFPEP